MIYRIVNKDNALANTLIKKDKNVVFKLIKGRIPGKKEEGTFERLKRKFLSNLRTKMTLLTKQKLICGKQFYLFYFLFFDL